MQNTCSKCGTKTTDTGDVHCRKVLVADVKQLLSIHDLEGARLLVQKSTFDENWEKWKRDMFERLSFDLRKERMYLKAEAELRERQEMERIVVAQTSPFLRQAEELVASGQFRESETFMLDNQMRYPTLPLLQRYNAHIRRRIPKEHLVPMHYTPRADWGRFENIRTKENLYQLVHVTDYGNIELIKRHGGIFSKQAMSEYGIRPGKYASSELSWELDKRNNLWDHIHVSIQKSPMMYVSAINPVTLLIDSRFIFAHETRFSDKNSADNGAIIGSAFEDFARINFQIAKGRWGTEYEKKLFQAEILVKHHIPIEFITFP